eukprot:3747602-Rhodomonas_salina.1
MRFRVDDIFERKQTRIGFEESCSMPGSRTAVSFGLHKADLQDDKGMLPSDAPSGDHRAAVNEHRSSLIDRVKYQSIASEPDGPAQRACCQCKEHVESLHLDIVWDVRGRWCQCVDEQRHAIRQDNSIRDPAEVEQAQQVFQLESTDESADSQEAGLNRVEDPIVFRRPAHDEEPDAEVHRSQKEGEPGHAAVEQLASLCIHRKLHCRCIRH